MADICKTMKILIFIDIKLEDISETEKFELRREASILSRGTDKRKVLEACLSTLRK